MTRIARAGFDVLLVTGVAVIAISNAPSNRPSSALCLKKIPIVGAGPIEMDAINSYALRG